MIFSAEAERNIDDLRAHFEARGRLTAALHLRKAIAQAVTLIEAGKARSLPAPRPYPGLAKPGRAWVKVGRYYFCHTTDLPPVMVAIFYDTADIPARLSKP